MMDLPEYIATQSGQLDGVLYVLLGEGRLFNFRGQPDFVLKMMLAQDRSS